ncbi:MAG: hypothetical protein DI582_05240 [Azospirillum brasilense]|nr:MAG: hypothetical protein DI582_05240 [Azospirillum brasilense]
MTFEAVGTTLNALPVTSIADDAVDSVMQGKVTIVAAPTGSGKSMVLPAKLADASGEPVVVLVPRRFLATDAASNVAQLAGTELGTDVGYAIGEMAGEKSKFSDKTKLLFVTYGYAISSGLINRAKNIVLDEVHEASEDISLARAILHERKGRESGLRLLEMSATVDASRQRGYWSDVADTAAHEVNGQQLACEERRLTPGRDSDSIAQIAVDLIRNEDRKGIAIFRSGIKDVEATVSELKTLTARAGLRNVEIVQVYGGTPADERAQARLAPKPGHCKIIVGTNVIESGVNLRWLDAGISDGTGKIPYDRADTGASALVLEDLPQWRIVQQRGRVNRAPDATGFNSGIFILHSNKEMAHRPQQATPELERRSLMNIAFRAACLGYDPESLRFDAHVEPARLQEAKDNLVRLGLIDDYWNPTRDGEYAARLPLSPENAAMLSEAQRMDVAAMRSSDVAVRKRPKILPDAIVMAALIEQGGIRDDYRRSHGLEGKSDVHGASDVLDGLKAYLQLERTGAARLVAAAANDPLGDTAQDSTVLEAARARLKEDCAKLNVSYVDFNEVMLLVGEIRARHPDGRALSHEREMPFDVARYDALKQTILHGNAHRLFQLQRDGKVPTYRDLLRDHGSARNDRGAPFNDYHVNEYSTLHGAQQSSRAPFLVGTLRELPPRRGALGEAPQIMIDEPTSVPAHVFVQWAAAHEPRLVGEVEYDRKHKGGELNARYAGAARFSIPLPKQTPELAAQLSQLAAGEDSWAASVHAGKGGPRQR